MKVQTGQGTIPLITLIGIFSISALNALPGLAVSPILGDLNKIFPSATDLEIQMLSSLPSLLIIPFILLSGKLTEKVNNLLLLQIGLAIFGVSGILYLLSNKMWQLIAISAMLGIGSGLIVPLSTGLISRYFVGAYRTKQFGHNQYHLGTGHYIDWLSGGSELAFAVFGLSVSFYIHFSYSLSEERPLQLSSV